MLTWVLGGTHNFRGTLHKAFDLIFCEGSITSTE